LLKIEKSQRIIGSGIDACATAYRMRRPRALRLLALGLDRYSDLV
jgi:hypothetical protein